MAFYAYHRVSSKQQHLDRGIAEIEDFCEKEGIELARPPFLDKITGKKFDRPRYTVLKEDVLRPGDTLIITEMDRLGRSKAGILAELRDYKEMGVIVRILELPQTLIDIKITNEFTKMILEAIQNLLIELYATNAEGELIKKNKRQREGIAAMKARGEWDKYGRPNKYDEKAFQAILKQREEGVLTTAQASSLLGISPASFYRYKKEFETKHIA